MVSNPVAVGYFVARIELCHIWLVVLPELGHGLAPDWGKCAAALGYLERTHQVNAHAYLLANYSTASSQGPRSKH